MVHPPSDRVPSSGFRDVFRRLGGLLCRLAGDAPCEDERRNCRRLDEHVRRLEGQIAAERDRHEQALRERESRLRVLTEQVPAVLWTTDRDLRFTTSMGSGLKFLGLRPGQVVGLTLHQYFQTQDVGFEPIAAHLRAIDGTPANYEFEWEGRTFQTHVEPFFDNEDRIVGSIGLAVDITERARLEHRLRESQKLEAMGTLAGGIAHDFNNILASILGNTQMCLADVPEGGVLRSNLQEIFKAGTRAKDLVGQILAFSRSADHTRRTIRIQPVVNEAVRFMRASLPSTIQIQKRLSGSALHVDAESTQIYQVLVNLCTNAGHAMDDRGGTLTVSLEGIEVSPEMATQHVGLQPGPHVHLSVRDEGHGIPSVIQERIFEPFFTTKPAGEGTGMGLAVVYGIVRGHGGAVEVESVQGHGATFHVYLPRAKAEDSGSIVPLADCPRGEGHVLFVDDEVAIVRVAKQMLESLGYEVTTSTDSRSALELFCANPERYDVVMTDQIMPGLEGDAFARELLCVRSDVPIILCTGYSERVATEEAQAKGIRKFLTKPILIEDMAKALHEVREQIEA